MGLISDLLLLCGTIAMMAYCFVLSRKLKKFGSFENGLGGAIAVLSAQVDEMKKALSQTEASAATASAQLETLVSDAKQTADRLDLLLAGLNDLPEPQGAVDTAAPPAPPEEAVLSFSHARSMRRKGA